MRKITSLLCLGALATTAMAAVQLPNGGIILEGLELNENACTTMAELQDEAIQISANGDAYTRTYNDGNEEWYFQLTRSTKYSVGDLYSYTDQDTGEKVPVTFEQWPFYIGMMQVSNQDSSSYFWYVVFWPSKLYYEQVWGMDSNYNPDDEETYNYDPADPEKLMNDTEDGLVHCFYQAAWDNTNKFGHVPYNYEDDDPSYMPVAWTMMGINQLFTNTCKMNGRDIKMHVVSSAEDRSRIEFETFNGSTKQMTAYMRFYYDDVATGQMSSKSYNWEGEVTKVAGWINYNFEFPKINELHIFKDKLHDAESLEDMSYMADDMAPVYRYYVAAYGEGVSLGLQKGYENDKTFGTGHFGFIYADGYPQDRNNINFVMGSIYAPASMTDFQSKGIYNMEQFEQVYDKEWNTYITLTYPHDYSMIPSASSSVFVPGQRDQDGFFGVSKGYYVYFDAPSKIQFGSTDGVIFSGTDTVGDIWSFKYNGKIIYHNDPSDILQTVEIDSVGTDDPIDYISAAVENIFTEMPALNVTVDGRNIVAPQGAVVYDLNGRRVNANGVDAGIYVVRNGKQAAKILVK